MTETNRFAGNSITTLFIPGHPKNSNAHSQWAKYAAATDRKKFRKATKEIAEQHYTPYGSYTYRVEVHAWLVSPYNRRRDPGGLAERLKPILDGIVDAGLLVDDDESHIDLILHRSIVDKKRQPGILIELRPNHEEL